jgi:predicted nucleic acid-binding protein
MNILVDTSIWSLALRRRVTDLTAADVVLRNHASELIEEGRIRMIGPIRQELLSGIRERRQYLELRDRLRAFPDESLNSGDYEQAAQMYNQCRAAGITATPIDLLICAVAFERQWEVFSNDRDFDRFAVILSFRLHRPQPH